MTSAENTCFVFAARYAHTRNTAGAYAVVTGLKAVWGDLDTPTRAQIVKESHEALYNLNDWDDLRKFAAAFGKCTWGLSDSHGSSWLTACGQVYDADAFGCSSIKVCPHCKRETTT